MIGESAAAPGQSRRVVSVDKLRATLSDLLDDGFVVALVSAQLMGDGVRISYAMVRAIDDARVEVQIRVAEGGEFPSAADLSYPVGRFEREIHDLYGVTPSGHPMPYRLVRHGHWPRGWYPMVGPSGMVPAFDDDVGEYPFTPVQGTGVYEIPVGPVHAGLIEPGHFRFSVVGETILRMKARLWFLHRGIERLFVGRTPLQAIELTERVSGDTAVGHTLAFCLAVEEALAVAVPDEVQLARAMLLELERAYNHIGDLGAMANDVGFSFAHSHAQRLREEMLRLNERLTGHRLLRGGVSVGTAHVNALPDRDFLRSIADQVQELVALTLGNRTVLDRFSGTAVLPRQAAGDLGTLGYVARASGLALDARRDHPFCELPGSFAIITEEGGDALARYRVRVGELAIAFRLIQDIAEELGGGDVTRVRRGEDVSDSPEDRGRPDGPPSAVRVPGALRGSEAGFASGLGLVEGWRGRIAHRVEFAADGTLARVKIVDPSFFNWPALGVALADTIVPDFPLANKSFNQSYAGNDL